MNSLRQKEGGKKVHEVERNGLRNSTTKRRFTAVHEENGNKSITATHGLEENKVAQNKNLKACEGNVTACKSSVLETLECSSQLGVEVGSHHIEEKNNGWQMSSVVKATEKTEGKGESSRRLKRTCTSSKELRHSP